MIGAMPAIAVRGKNKTDGSIGFMSRPHKLSLHFRPPLTHHQVTPTPSPVNSPPGLYQAPRDTAHYRFARNFVSKRCIFQLSVLSPLVGVILLFIGLIQLTPGAEASPFAAPLIIAGSSALLLGILVIILRVYFTWELNRLNSRRADVPQIKVNEPSFTDPDLEKAVNATSNESGGGAASEINKPINKSPLPTSKQEHIANNKDQGPGQGRDESSKLLEQGEKNVDKNGSSKGPTTTRRDSKVVIEGGIVKAAQPPPQKV